MAKRDFTDPAPEAVVDQNDAEATASEEVVPAEAREEAAPADAPVEAPQKVKVRLNPNFTQPVLEEYEDEQGRKRGKVVDHVAPDSVRLTVADQAEPIELSSDAVEVDAAVAKNLRHLPAVELVD